MVVGFIRIKSICNFILFLRFSWSKPRVSRDKSSFLRKFYKYFQLKNYFYLCFVKKSNNTTSKSILITTPSFDDINRSNQSFLIPFGLNTDYYMRLNGLTDRTLAKRVGCAHSMIFELRKGNVKYCGISLLSRIAIALGFTLGDWLKVEQPEGIERPGVFCTMKHK